MLLTGLAGLGGDFLLDGVTVGARGSLQAFGVSRESLDGGVGDLAGKRLEVRGRGDEVGLATEADEDSLATFDTGEDGTFGGLAVRTLGSDELTLLTDDVDSLLEVAFGLDEGLLAVHHTGGSHLTQFHYVLSGNFHNMSVL